MKVAIITNMYDIQLIERDEPEIMTPNEVKVKMLYAGIVGNDMEIFKGFFAPPEHHEFGMEGAGVIVDRGPLVKNLEIGDQVVLARRSACGTCAECKKGNRRFCKGPVDNPGLFAEYVVYPQNAVFKLEGLSPRHGCLITSMSCALNSVTHAQLNFGKDVLIWGGGTVGQLTLQIARSCYANKVVVVDTAASMRELALQFYADKVMDPNDPNFYVDMLTDSPSGFDLVVEASGNAEAAEQVYGFLARGGTAVYTGQYRLDYELRINTLSFYWKGATICSEYYDFEVFPRCIKLARKLELDSIITGEYPFADIRRAFLEKESQEHAKVILRF